MPSQEEIVAKINDLQNGEMKQVTVGETDVLLARQNNKFYALHAYCTHYGAPLAEGVLNGNRLVCPWHHACFDVTSGHQLEAPGMDGLPSYEVRTEGEDVIVRVNDPEAERETPPMVKKDASNNQVYAVLGGGAAGAYAVEAMREAGYTGRIIMITRETDIPYDRVNCSKEFLQDEAPEEWMPLRSEEFYSDLDIEFMMGKTVTKVNAAAKKITFKDGETLVFDKLLLCTGGVPRKLEVPGNQLDNVFTLRSMKDSERIRDAGKTPQQVVVVGSSFIAMESAWSLSKLGCEVTVVSPDSAPFADKWGERIGKMIKHLHEENGIDFRLGEKVGKLEGKDQIERVVLETGEILEATLVLIGIGVQPATGFLEDISLEKDKGIQADQYLKVTPDVYAAGDIVHFPYMGDKVRIEHWKVACQQGRIAGYNMAGKKEPYKMTPFFWSTQQETNFRYVGYVKDYDRIIYDGNVEEEEFIAFYIKNKKVLAALGVNRDEEMAAIQELIREDNMPDLDDLEAGYVDYLSYLS